MKAPSESKKLPKEIKTHAHVSHRVSTYFIGVQCDFHRFTVTRVTGRDGKKWIHETTGANHEIEIHPHPLSAFTGSPPMRSELLPFIHRISG